LLLARISHLLSFAHQTTPVLEGSTRAIGNEGVEVFNPEHPGAARPATTRREPAAADRHADAASGAVVQVGGRLLGGQVR